MLPEFVHLRVHSEYSLVDGLVRIRPLVKAVAAAGMPAVALTDQSNLFAMVKFYRAAAAAGVKPIIGVDLHLHNDRNPGTPSHVTLLCKDHGGYLNLNRLISRGYLEGQRSGAPYIERPWLAGNTGGLIALSGGRQGDIGQALLQGQEDQAAALLHDWMALFPEAFYLELQRTGREHEEIYNAAAVALAAGAGAPVVATNDVMFLRPEDFAAHEARVCIHDGRTLTDPRRPRRHSEQQYLRSPAEMAALFADLPEALHNTVEIARRCSLSLVFGKPALPDFPLPAGTTVEDHLRRQARCGLERKLQAVPPDHGDAAAAPHQPYWERLERELGIIIDMGFPGYFLIVADFIRWAKENDIPVGPGRGSGAGSLVAYSLGITDLDPMRYDLLFERFLNPERVSLPDFDIDFCMEGRDRVIEYVADRYGRDRVSQIITYGSMAAKAVVRDVGRVLGHPYGFVDQIAKLIPFELGMTLDKALEQEELLRQRYEQEEEVRALIDLARALEGLARNAGKHAGGVVIAPAALTDFMPLYCERGGGGTVSQFDKDDVEAIGLVKFDFLGLRTLTIIDRAVKILNGRRRDGEAAVDMSRLPMDDAAVFALMQRCATTAVFQLESRGMKDLVKRLQPDCFDEIIALVALFRPGPLQSGMVDDFIDRKHGRARAEYPHPDLEPILKSTYGIILYQEQVMQIAQVLAGYTLGQADLLRRAMGKKKPEEMAKQREFFVAGARGNGVKEDVATYIFDLMEKFAGYGFNKSHSAAYALLSYQTAWLKAHHPAAFMAAVLSADMDNTNKVVTFIDECRDMELQVLPPDVNSGGHAFQAGDEATIRYGLGAIKGVGAAAVEEIVAERGRGGAYADLFDFCRRIDLRKANRRVIEALIRAGAMDAIGPNRATLTAALGEALSIAEKHVHDDAAGQDDLFGGAAPLAAGGGAAVAAAPGPYAVVDEWDEEQRLLGEKETLGLYLTGHPILRYEQELARFVSSRIVDLRPTSSALVTITGLVVAMRTMNSRRGDKIAFITLDDRSGRIELAVFADAYRTYRELLAKDRILVVEGSVSVDEYSGGFKMSAERVFDIDRAREAFAKRLVIRVEAGQAANGFIDSLASTLSPYRDGTCPVWLDYRNQDARAQVALGQEWRVRPTDDLLRRLQQLAGTQRVQVVY